MALGDLNKPGVKEITPDLTRASGHLRVSSYLGDLWKLF